MKTQRPIPPAVSDRTFRAAGLFARMADSIDRGNLADAAEAQASLARYGFHVHVGAEPARPETRRASLSPFPPRQPKGGA